MTDEKPTGPAGVICRVLSRAIGLLFLVIGLGFMALPDLLASSFSVLPAYASGLNSIRGDFGGLFLGMSFFCLLGAGPGRSRWLLVPIVFLCLIIIGRLVGLVMGNTSPSAIPSVRLEVIMVVILTTSLVVLLRSKGPSGNDSQISEVLNPRMIIGIAVVALILVGLLSFQRGIGMGLMNRMATRVTAADPISDLSDGLSVALCGSGSPLQDPRRASACTAVIAGKDLYVVDTGPGSERKLELMRLNPGRVRAVLLTHFHSDHIGDLGELILKRWSGGSRETPLEVYGPEGVEMVVEGFNDAYALDTEYRIEHHGPEVVPPEGAGGLARPFHFPSGEKEVTVMERDGLKITAFEVDHDPVRPAVGYRFDYKGRSVVLSGDTITTPLLLSKSRGADLLIHEALQPEMITIMRDAGERIGRANMASIMEDILTYHASPEDAAKLAEEAGVRHLLLNHIIPPLPVSDLKAAFLGDARKHYSGPITVGEDGMFFSLPAENNKIIAKWLL